MRRPSLLALVLLAVAAPSAGAVAVPGPLAPAAPLPAGCDVLVPALPGAASAAVAVAAPGATVCLAPGLHAGNVAVKRPGLTLRPAARGRATLRGQLWIADGADRVTVTGLELDGRNAAAKPSPLVNADDATFTRNDVHHAQESCFVLGDKVWGVAERTRIAGNLVHDCGVPDTNMDHGIYVRQAVGTRIEGNVIRDNADRGVQLYPNADDTLVRGNLIERNGEGVIFSAGGGDVSERNRVEGNVIRRSRLRFDVESWAMPPGTSGNVVRGNCIGGGRRGAIQSPAVGFRAQRNVLRAKSPCAVRPPVLDLHG